MPGWLTTRWQSGAKGRLFHRGSTEDPSADTLVGFVRHEHINSGGFTAWGGFDLGSLEYPSETGGVWTLKGYKCPVKIFFERNGVAEEVELHAGNDHEATITAALGESIDAFSVRAR
jgi:hypothetical protein